MDKTLQKFIADVCQGFTSPDVQVSNIFDARRFARMTHYAWKHEIGFHSDMFKDALSASRVFSNFPDEVLEEKAHELCLQADFAKQMFYCAFDIEGLKS